MYFLLLIALFLLIGWSVVWSATHLARRRLLRGVKSVSVLYKMNRTIRYFNALCFFPFLVSMYIAGLQLTRTEVIYSIRLLELTLIVAVSYTLLRTGYSVLRYKIARKILSFDISWLSYIWRTFIRFLIVSVVFAMFYFAIALNPEWTASHRILTSLYVMGIILLIGIVGTEFAYLFRRTRKLKASEIPETWQNRIEKIGLKNVEFRVWRTKNLRVANAMATGLLHPRVIVSDYLMEVLTPQQTEATIMHELGHIKKRHLLWHLLMIEIWVPFIVCVSGFMIRWHTSPVTTLVLELGFLVAYQGLLMRWISRVFEYQADAFSVNQIEHPEHMGQALQTISEVNFSLLKIPSFDELWMTHPSMHKRILRVATAYSDERTNGSETGELEAFQ